MSVPTSQRGERSEPLISVLMAVHNASPYLEACLASLRRQESAPPFEIIAVNDGSTDDSGSVLEALAGGYPNLVVLHQENAGPSRARNLAFRHSRGRYLAIVDSDDLCHPQRFQHQAAFLDRNPNIHMVGSYFKQINSLGKVIKSIDALPTDPEALRAYLKDRNPICHGTIMLRREAFEALGGYREILCQAEDYDLFLRLISRWDLALIPLTLYYHRVHGGSLSARDRLQQLQMRNLVLSLYHAKLRTGEDPLDALDETERREYLETFLARDLRMRKYDYAAYLQDLGHKMYRVGELEASKHNFRQSMRLAPAKSRTLRYLIKIWWKNAQKALTHASSLVRSKRSQSRQNAPDSGAAAAPSSPLLVGEPRGS